MALLPALQIAYRLTLCPTAPPPAPAYSMTTNCIIEPRQSYKDRIFTTGEVGWSGVSHIEGKIGQTKDYSAVINKALEMPGFTEEPAESEAKFVTTGFARNAVLSVAGDVVKAVQDGHLKHIFLIGGCDGSEPDRKYFGKVADATPQDTMLLTLGCGKFRFYDHDYGMLPNTGLPRLVSFCAFQQLQGRCGGALPVVHGACCLPHMLPRVLTLTHHHRCTQPHSPALSNPHPVPPADRHGPVQRRLLRSGGGLCPG
jgi:hydroxylamine reductase